MRKLQRSPFHVAVFHQAYSSRSARSQESTESAVMVTGQQAIADLQHGGDSTSVAAALLNWIATDGITSAAQLPDSYRGLGQLAGLD
ncbi:hypothetical protein [Pseudomonas aeruginosa]|uniref:hypothetical protein n=1 Tax=Pseudomonas aeruginosa TaxID=287 RepID=UPI001ADA2236|nr:hypothetical protein [Pseudomonas aeruginosa]MBO8337056.1 hypothetical protein [Pseudomonas aeruginosa]HCF4080899.1 hypothetical protein [Pseudomonas aeruginosa]